MDKIARGFVVLTFSLTCTRARREHPLHAMKWLLVVFGAFAALPVTASAAARYASPTPSGTMDCSSAANACDVKTAIEFSGMNDDIYVPGNLGDYHVSSSITPAATPVHVHGTDGRPRLILAGSLTLKGPSTAEDLYIEGPGTTFGLHSPGGGSVDNLIVKVTDTGHACYFSGGHTLTNSVCWAASTGDLAVETDGTNTFRNDTLVGGTEAAIKGFARNPDCSCAAATDTLVNVIARSGGSGHDLEANSDNSADMTFDVKYSNYATTVTTGTGSPGKTHINGDATDQSTPPLFVNPAAGDFHEAPGSPTIDHGINDSANGATDFDGDPRTLNGTTDIGADEFNSPPPTTTTTLPTVLPPTACPDAQAAAAIEAMVEAQCHCSTASNHGKFVRCAKHVAKGAAALSKSCKRAVANCAGRSTCGKPGFVTCCRTTAKGKTTCSTKSDAAHCKATRHGTACVGKRPSCCDACVSGGCAAP